MADDPRIWLKSVRLEQTPAGVPSSPLTIGDVRDFARLDTLMTIFDGDPSRWLLYLEARPLAEESLSDRAFLARVQQRLFEVPDLLDRMQNVMASVRELLEEFRAPVN